jgi:hypothetical protein
MIQLVAHDVFNVALPPKEEATVETGRIARDGGVAAGDV